MTLFWFEIAHFLIAIFAVLVCFSAASLFFLVIRTERQLQTLWRAIGFSSLALAFLLFILERKYAILGIPALVVQVFAYISIYLGVFAEPKLSQLLQIGNKPKATEHAEFRNVKSTLSKNNASPITTFFPVLIILVLITVFWRAYLPASLAALATLFIGLTIPIQIRRYQRERKDLKARRLNLYPLLGYIALFFGAFALILFRLPSIDIIILRQAILDYSSVWQTGQFFLLIGFFFLAIWAWTFIRVRPFLRTYIVFLSIAILVSSLGSLIFTMLIFGIVEKNNLQLMSQGAKTENLLLQKSSDEALFLARTIGNDTRVLQAYGQHDLVSVRDQISMQLNNSGADVIRIYDASGKIVVNPSDPRDEGRTIKDDNFLNFVLTTRNQYKTFDIRTGVLAPQVITRALFPIINSQQNITGVVEVNYLFDNAFVDYSKGKTSLDVTIYAGTRRSATTIYTQDNVSRWTGSLETDQNVITKTIDSGQLYSTSIDRLGRPYYSAFEAIRDVNGRVIGMMSVGTPASVLFEETRQQLITTFLVVVLISLLVALIGYLAIRSFGRK